VSGCALEHYAGLLKQSCAHYYCLSVTEQRTISPSPLSFLLPATLVDSLYIMATTGMRRVVQMGSIGASLLILQTEFRGFGPFQWVFRPQNCASNSPQCDRLGKRFSVVHWNENYVYMTTSLVCFLNFLKINLLMKQPKCVETFQYKHACNVSKHVVSNRVNCVHST